MRRLPTKEEAPPRSRFYKEGATVSPEAARMVYVPDPADPTRRMVVGRSIGPEDAGPGEELFMRSTPETLDEPEEAHTPGFIRTGDNKPSPAPARPYYR